ncbi:MAG: hypothetical protein OXT09_12320, partial [Myxococcales bacterium]|nr:hypothetical protein [Myxococcales bacterium]
MAEQLIARLQNDPGDGAAYEELKDFYRQSGDLASLANLLEGWAGNNTSQWDQASHAYVEAADAVMGSSGDVPRARALYQQALHLNVGHPDAGARLRALLEEHGEPQELAEFLDGYARALEQAGGPPEYIADLYTRLGELWQGDFGQPDTASAFFNRATELRRSAAAPNATPSAAAQPVPDGDPAGLAEQLEAQAQQAAGTEQRIALLTQLASLRVEQQGDLEGGIVALRQALADVPGDIQVMHQLASYLLTRAEGLDEQAAAADHRRVAELFYQIAQGVDDTQAMEYLGSALQANPGHTGAMDMIEQLAPTMGHGDALPGYWVAYVAAAGDGPDADLRRLSLAEAYLAAGQLEDASYCLRPAAERGNERAHELLQSVYGQQATLDTIEEDHEDEEATAAGGRRSLPTARPPARRSDAELARNTERITQLRQRVHELVTARRHDEAADLCREILELDANDPEAFNLLESQYRKKRDHAALRDLLLASTRTPGLSVDARKLRLREAATLSESKLREADAAISAWRGVVTLDPADRDATRSLKRLLKRAQQWDELASVLEREALATTGVDEKVALLREIAVLHRDRRKDLVEAAEAFRQLYALKPGEKGVRDELAELFVKVEAWEDAVPVLREKLDDTAESRQQLRLAHQLAEILQEKLARHDDAYEICERALSIKSSDREAFERMERIDEESGNHSRLLGTLERRALLAPKAERPALFMRMGVIAEEQLGDLDKAADYLGDALDLAPTETDALSRLTAMCERAGRYADLVELLRERTVLEKDANNRVALHRRIARVLSDYLEDDDGAAESWQQVLGVEEDEEGLRFLKDRAVRQDDHAGLAGLLGRLAAKVESTEEQRDFLFDRAVVLHEKLDSSAEAAAALKRIVEELDPDFVPAIEELATVCEATGDQEGLATALERQLALGEGDDRLGLARRLSDLAEHELKQALRAIAALQVWAEEDSRNPEPHRRLRDLLEAEEQWEALVTTLDALSDWEDEFEAREDATIAAALAAFEHLADADGAWKRLLPLVEDRHEQAEEALHQVAKGSGRQAHLAALYVRLAQETEQTELQGIYWRSASEVYEHELGQPDQAFEAALRMLATDLHSPAFLEIVDRLALETSAFPRLAQVYDRLLKLTDDGDAKVELLRRHAALLDEPQPSEALDRVLRACGLAPQDEDLLVRAEKLAQRTKRSEEMLVVYDRRCAKSDDAPDKVRLMIRAARLSDSALHDRTRADGYLKSALGASLESPELAASVEQAAAELDETRPEAGTEQSRRALVQSHAEIAQKVAPEVAAGLMMRGAELLEELGDPRAAFDVLRQGNGLLPAHDELWERLVGAGKALGRLDAVDAHLARLIDDAIDSDTTVALLRRRGELLEGVLDRMRDAAAVYDKILQLRPSDEDAAGKLRASLRESGRFQDLLVAINKQLQRTGEPSERLSLLEEIAQTWERDLRNRWEALDAWRAVLGQDPEHEEALAAVERLEAGRGSVVDADAPEVPSEPPDEDAGADGEQSPEEAAVAAEEGGDEVSAEASSTESEPEATTDDLDAGADTAVDIEAAAGEADQVADASEEGEDRDTDEELGAPAFDDSALTDAVPEAATAGADVGAESLEADAQDWQAQPSPFDEPTASEPAPPPQPAAAAADSEDEEEAEGDLASLDAALASDGGPEELDVFDGIEEVDVGVAVDPPAPRAGRVSSAPPPPPRVSRPGSMPPPLPGARASVPPPPPGSAASGGSMPPPVPGGSAPPPPPQGSRPPGSIPPVPARASRPSMPPPPVPGGGSRPPGSVPPAPPKSRP